MKRISAIALMLFVVMAAVVPMSAFAYTGGLINGLLGSNYFASGSLDDNNVTQWTDNDELTSALIRASQGYGEFTLPSVATITNMKAKSSMSTYEVRFYNSSNTLISTEYNPSYNSSVVDIADVANVKKIRVYNVHASVNMTLSEIDFNVGASDTTSPAVPTGLTGSAGDGQAVLNWTANGEADLADYRIYKDNVLLSTVAKPATTYTATGLTNGTIYSFTITARDTTGNESAKSTVVNVTPIAAPDTTAPAKPTGLTATAGDGSVSLGWTANSEPDLEGYFVYRDGVKITGTPIVTTNFTDIGRTNGTVYSYAVTAVDTSGNESSESTAATATPTAAPDTTPPAAPTGLTATPGPGRVTLSWIANTEPDLAGYNVYQDGFKVNTAAITDNQYTVTDLVYGQSYDFHVTGLDLDGNESGSSGTVTSAPSQPDDSIEFAGITLPFGVVDLIASTVSFLGLYGEWILLALAVIFAPALYGLAMKLISKLTGNDRSRKEWILRERSRRLYWRSEEGKEKLERVRKEAGISKEDWDRSTREDRAEREQDRKIRSGREGRPGRA